jgi:hypothetical protein
MAPITATTQGIERQTIDDPELVDLLKRLSSYDTTNNDANGSDLRRRQEQGQFDHDSSQQPECVDLDVDVEGLVGELERWSYWKFQELVSE